MKWRKRLLRAVGIALLLAVLSVAGWIFWPVSPPSEQALLSGLPPGAVVVVILRDFDTHWADLERRAFFRAWKESPWNPRGVSANSTRQRVVERAGLDLIGKRAVIYRVAGTEGLCILGPVTPRVKWLWLRAWAFQRWPGSGFVIRSKELIGKPVHEIVWRRSPDLKIEFARNQSRFLFTVNSPESVGLLFHPPPLTGGEELRELAQSRADAILLGMWRQETTIATWALSKPQPQTFRLEVALPKLRTVRLPWDAARGPRSMAVIQKLFPDQGALTIRGRVSHWMAAWDNLIAWLRLSPDLYSETLFAHLKYGENLSHGLFPWSGAGDEFACVVAPAATDAPLRWQTVGGALRCWETNDTQAALDQFLPSLGRASGAQFRIEPPTSSNAVYTIHVRLPPGTETPACFYRYADGLVIASNSRRSLEQFDTTRISNEVLQPTQPENQFWCEPKALAGALMALSSATRLWGDPMHSQRLCAVAAVLQGLGDLRLTIHVEAKTVRYEAQATAL
jgi:hypothetical protein